MKTYVPIVIDKSGSMSSRKEKAIADFNQQIQAMRDNTQRDPNLEIFVSLVIFDHQVSVVYENTPLSEVTELTSEQYQPDGSTALFDAIDKAITLTQPNIKNPTDAALVVVITDGHENASSADSRQYVPKRIKELEETNAWTFTYLGTDQNLAEFTERLHARKGNIKSGIDQLGTGVTTSLHNHYFSARSRGHTSVVDSYTGSSTPKNPVLYIGNPRNIKRACVIIRAEKQDILESLRNKLNSFTGGEIKVLVTNAGIGAIRESDTLLALSYGAIILGLNVPVEKCAQVSASKNNVTVKTFINEEELLKDFEKHIASL